jgi:hypothetical protein
LRYIGECATITSTMKNSADLYSKPITDQRLAVKMVRYCRENFGARGQRWDFEGHRNIRFCFTEDKDRTWFYFVFAHDLKDPYEG